MKFKETGFYITGKSGFQVVFENGWTVSVQFGPMNYCDHYGGDWDDREALAREGSSTAEVATWGSGGELVDALGWGDSVGARQTPAQVLELLQWAAAQRVEELR